MKMNFTHRGRFAPLFAVAAILYTISCTKDATSEPGATPDTSAGQYLCFEAGTSEDFSGDAEGAVSQDTRAGYDSSLGHAVWEAGDDIGVWNDNNANVRFTQKPGTLSADRRTVDFEGTLPNPATGNQTFYAIYPYDPSITRDSYFFTMNFSGHQVYKPGGYTGIPLFGKYEGDVANLKFSGFKNPFCVFELRLASEEPIKVKRIVVKDNYEETLSGTIKVNLSGERPGVVFEKGSGSEIIALDCGEGVTLSTDPTSFYIAVAEGNFDAGIQFNIRLDREGANSIVLNSKGKFKAKGNTIVRTPVRTISTADCIYTIPDTFFRNYLLNKGVVSVVDETTNEVTITQPSTDFLQCYNKGISAVDGIEYFPDMGTLACANNKIVSIDLSRNTKLTRLECDNNRLTKLDLSKNTSLTSVKCSTNRLTELDMSKNTEILWLECSGNQLTKLDVSKNAKLTNLDCSKNRLTQLDVSKNAKLNIFDCSNNRLTQLDASKMSYLDKSQPFMLQCGCQTYITLQLKLSEKQRTWWLSGLQSNVLNANVTTTFIP